MKRKAKNSKQVTMPESSVQEAFLLWEAASRDTLDFKRCYVDVAGDIIAGLLLSQIVYWFLPDRDGNSKLTVERGGKRWLAKGREDWWEECRITGKQFDRAVASLEELGLVEAAVFRFGKSTMKHVTVQFENLVEKLRKNGGYQTLGITQRSIQELPKGENRNSREVNPRIDVSAIPNKEEITAESTSEITAESKSLPLPLSGVNKTSEDFDAKATARPETRGRSAAEHLLRQLVPAASTEQAEDSRSGRVDLRESVGNAEGSRPQVQVKPLVGKRTAQEILDHYRKPAREQRGGDFDSIASIAKVMAHPTVSDWRIGFEGVLQDIRHALFQTSINLGSKRPPHLADGATEWQECFESAVVADYEADEVSGVPMLIVTSANPAKTAAAFKKYSKRIEDGMEKYFGQVVQISVRSEA